MNRKFLALALLALLAALGVAACGGSSSSSTGSDTAESSEAEPASDTKPASNSSEVVKTMTVTAINSTTGAWPEAKYAAEAYASWVNKNGGVGGRELDMIFCDTEGTSTGAAHCAQQAVSEGVVAVIGGFLLNPQAMFPVLEQANIAWLGSLGGFQEEYSQKMLFPTLGLAALEAGGSYQAAKEGCEHLTIVNPEVPGDELTESLNRNGFVAGGGDAANWRIIRYAPTTTDLAPTAAEATKGSDCIYGYFPSPVMPAWLEALKSVGGTQRIVGYVGEISEATAKKFAPQLKGSIAASAYQNWKTDPGFADFRKGLQEVDAPDELDYGWTGQATWVSYVQFNEIAAGIEGEITPDNFYEAASNANHVEAGGLTAPLDFTKEFTGLKGEIPRNFNPYAVLGTFKNGGPVLQPGFEDMTSVIDGEPPK
jgi:ABC-type branched-subunit amino acid transport system substrate-binding protein